MQEKKFEQERMNMIRSFETEMESKARLQKQQVEKTEQMQENELRQMSKKIRSDQVGSTRKQTIFLYTRPSIFGFICLGKRDEDIQGRSEARAEVNETGTGRTA